MLKNEASISPSTVMRPLFIDFSVTEKMLPGSLSGPALKQELQLASHLGTKDVKLPNISLKIVV